MSQDWSNPYQASAVDSSAASDQPAQPYPVFCRVMFILDLVFVGLRALGVAFGVIGMLMMQAAQQPDPMVAQTGMWEISTGLLIVIGGLLANGLMLSKSMSGAYFAVLKVIGVLGSYGVAVWQFSFVFDKFPEGSPERVGAVGGAVISMAVRFALLAAWVVAVFMFVRWKHSQTPHQDLSKGY